MADYVLVHGGNMSTDTWNELAERDDHPAGGTLGGKVWDPIVSALEARGHSVFAPTLADEQTCDLTAHIEQVCALITGHDLRGVVLAGHSYGGMVITGTAAKMPDRIGHLVYVDAALPDPGQSLFDIIASSGSDPLSFVGLEPAPPYVEMLRFDARAVEPLPKTYVLCTESEFAVVTQVARQKIAAGGGGWTYLEWPTCHVPMATMPDALTELLSTLAAAA